jgi:8-oxo-dGTP pyrophosphatase MutT (NUDIX family)
MHNAVLIYLLREKDGQKEVCLGLKKESARSFGVGKWNGFGGRMESGEFLRGAAVREVNEECGVEIDVRDLVLVAILEFFFSDLDPELNWDQTVYVYIVKSFSGEPQETEEMRPAWFPLAAEHLPWEKMWSSDKLWLLRVLSGEKIKGQVSFKGRGEEILSSKIT